MVLRAYLEVPYGLLLIGESKGAMQRWENQMGNFLGILPYHAASLEISRYLCHRQVR